ncbi:MAG: hypothetical protein ACF8OB_09275 [Phycisphaeraceae bacterium JB051]
MPKEVNPGIAFSVEYAIGGNMTLDNNIPDIQGLPDPEKTRREKLEEFLKKHKVRLRFESWHPFFIGFVCMVVIWSFDTSHAKFSVLLKETGPLAVSVAAILAGFQGTVHAILLSMLRTRIVKGLQKNEQYDYLVKYISEAIFSLIVFVVFALAALAIDATNTSISLACPQWICVIFTFIVKVIFLPASLSAFATGFLVGLFIYAILASIRIMRLNIQILTASNNTLKDS